MYLSSLPVLISVVKRKLLTASSLRYVSLLETGQVYNQFLFGRKVFQNIDNINIIKVVSNSSSAVSLSSHGIKDILNNYNSNDRRKSSQGVRIRKPSKNFSSDLLPSTRDRPSTSKRVSTSTKGIENCKVS